jgi:hypothetical protein
LKLLKKIMDLYDNAELFSERPSRPSRDIYLFFDKAWNEWVGIPKSTLSNKELTLLSTLYELVEDPFQPINESARRWYDFLFLNGTPPSIRSGSYFRFIQFHKNGGDAEQVEIESALMGFFSDDVVILWENNNNGIIIEERSHISLTENEITSISDTLESDLYIRVSFYIGKQYPFSEQLGTQFQQEREYFSYATKQLPSANVISFERVFPAFAVGHLPLEVKNLVKNDLLKVLEDDLELFTTIKVFLENNMNASMTAKKLYIHRNTLQYRIDKFVEKTGIPLKDFYGAFTVFLACLLYEQN